MPETERDARIPSGPTDILYLPLDKRFKHILNRIFYFSISPGQSEDISIRTVILLRRIKRYFSRREFFLRFKPSQVPKRYRTTVYGQIAKTYIPHVLDSVGSILLRNCFFHTSNTQAIMEKDYTNKLMDEIRLHPERTHLGGKVFRRYMEFSDIAQHLLYAGVQSAYAVNEMVTSDIDESEGNCLSKKFVTGFQQINSMIFEPRKLGRGGDIQSILVPKPFGGLRDKEVDILRDIINQNGYFASQERKHAIARLRTVLVQTPGHEVNKSSELKGMKGWIKFSQNFNFLKPESQNTVERIHNLVSMTVNLVQTTEPSYTKPFLEAINLFFVNLGQPLSPEQVLHDLFQNIMFLFFLKDLSTITNQAVKRLNPELYIEHGISRHKYFKFYYICLKSSYLQSKGIKTGKYYQDTVDKIMHTELGQRYHTYILCSQHIQDSAEKLSQSGSMGLYNIDEQRDNLEQIHLLHETRPMKSIGIIRSLKASSSLDSKTSGGDPMESLIQTDDFEPGEIGRSLISMDTSAAHVQEISSHLNDSVGSQVMNTISPTTTSPPVALPGVSDEEHVLFPTTSHTISDEGPETKNQTFDPYFELSKHNGHISHEEKKNMQVCDHQGSFHHLSKTNTHLQIPGPEQMAGAKRKLIETSPTEELTADEGVLKKTLCNQSANEKGLCIGSSKPFI